MADEHMIAILEKVKAKYENGEYTSNIDDITNVVILHMWQFVHEGEFTGSEEAQIQNFEDEYNKTLEWAERVLIEAIGND